MKRTLAMLIALVLLLSSCTLNGGNESSGALNSSENEEVSMSEYYAYECRARVGYGIETVIDSAKYKRLNEFLASTFGENSLKEDIFDGESLQSDDSLRLTFRPFSPASAETNNVPSDVYYFFSDGTALKNSVLFDVSYTVYDDIFEILGIESINSERYDCEVRLSDKTAFMIKGKQACEVYRLISCTEFIDGDDIDDSVPENESYVQLSFINLDSEYPDLLLSGGKKITVYESNKVTYYNYPTLAMKTEKNLYEQINNLLASAEKFEFTEKVNFHQSFKANIDVRENVETELAVYYNMSDFKGLELYAVNDNGEVKFVLLSGTNRMKTKEEVESYPLATLGEMRKILSSYKASALQDLFILTFYEELAAHKEYLYAILNVDDYFECAVTIGKGQEIIIRGEICEKLFPLARDSWSRDASAYAIESGRDNTMTDDSVRLWFRAVNDKTDSLGTYWFFSDGFAAMDLSSEWNKTNYFYAENDIYNDIISLVNTFKETSAKRLICNVMFGIPDTNSSSLSPIKHYDFDTARVVVRFANKLLLNADKTDESNTELIKNADESTAIRIYYGEYEPPYSSRLPQHRTLTFYSNGLVACQESSFSSIIEYKVIPEELYQYMCDFFQFKAFFESDN